MKYVELVVTLKTIDLRCYLKLCYNVILVIALNILINHHVSTYVLGTWYYLALVSYVLLCIIMYARIQYRNTIYPQHLQNPYKYMYTPLLISSCLSIPYFKYSRNHFPHLFFHPPSLCASLPRATPMRHTQILKETQYTDTASIPMLTMYLLHYLSY